MSRATETLPAIIKIRATRPWPERIQILTRSLAPVLLVAILVLAATFRLTGVNWDSNKHLHPDERFLTSVANDIKWPTNLDTYFDPKASSLSPYSLPNMGLYVYGTLPLWLVKGVAILLNANTYDEIAIVGRIISALFDIASIGVLYLIGRRLYGRVVALLGATLLSLSVLNIQQSHFFTVDTYANLFVVLVMLLALRICERGRWTDYALIGLTLGAGMATKLSVATLIVPILLAAGWDFVRQLRTRERPVASLLERSLVRMLLFAVLTLLTFRILQPIAFQGPEFWNFSLNKSWLDNIDEQSKILSGDADAPPWVQWTNRPALIFPLENMLLWGMGLPLGLVAWAGWALAAYELVRKQRWLHLLPLAYVGVTFLYHGTLFVKFMRYFLPIYPFLALFAAYLLIRWYRWITARLRSQNEDRSAAQRSRARLVALAPAAIVVLGTFLWAVAFTSIYTRPHSRVAASFWMYDHLKPGSVVANEHWDDWLPLAIGGTDMYAQKTITGVEIPNFDDDNPEKLDRIVGILTKADYLVLSSNRLYDSIPRLPMRYPMTVRYYELLFEGQLGFKKVAEFSSYPQILGLNFPDQSSEEAFTVYDHPRVQIFQKQSEFNPQQVRTLLSNGVDWDSVARLLPKQATKAPDLFQFTNVERLRYSDTAAHLGPAPWAGFANAFPLVFWALSLLLIWMAALPLSLVAFGQLRDRGYPFARTIGLLLTAWLSWLVSSAKIAPFTWWLALLVLIGVAIVSWAIGYVRRAELLVFWREQRRTIMTQEMLFWGCFFAFVLVRALNPDLWHPGLGGEKPMDTAYLNAVANTPFFPSYDPWYAGGYINYYYFGFVLVATSIHLSGVDVTTAYNLAVPTLFALTATGACSVAANLAHMSTSIAPRNWLTRALSGPRGWLAAGLLGALFVVGMGNLGQVQLLWDGLQEMSTIKGDVPSDPAQVPPQTQDVGNRAREVFMPLPRAADGLIQLLFYDKKFNFRQEWWYWNATRVYPAAKDEAGAITEFPLFTFLFADLHAHMMSLPLSLLALGLCVQLLLSTSARRPTLTPLPLLPERARGDDPIEHDARPSAPVGEGLGRGGIIAPSSEQPESGVRSQESEQLLLSTEIIAPSSAATLDFTPGSSPVRNVVPAGWGVTLLASLKDWLQRWPEFLTLGLTALTIGALWPTNTWDFPTYVLLVGLALALAAYTRNNGRIDADTLLAASWRWGLILVLGFLFFKPFHDHSASAYFGAEQWKGSRTPLWAYLIVHGFFLFVLSSYLIHELTRRRGLGSPARLLGIALRHRRPQRLQRLYGRLVHAQPLHELFVVLAPAFSFGLLFLIAIGHFPEAVALLLTALALLVFCSPQPHPQRQFISGLIAVGALLTAIVEVVVLKGDISRMNTVFKFYLQVWVMWSVAAAAAMPALAERLGKPAASVVMKRPIALLAGRWWRVFALLLAGCLLYPITAIPNRIKDRFDGVTAVTLDGTAYMRTASYTDQNQPIVLEYDREAINWIHANISGLPTIVEANTPLYRWGSRVAIYTGLPTVIGWDWHQKQQRSVLPGEYIDRRIEDVKAIYSDPNPDVARRLLRRYNVEYIYVGKNERIYYAGDGINKFEQLNGQFWDKVYENPDVQIYRVRPSL